MTPEQKQMVIGLIDFAWKNRAFTDPQSALEVEKLRQEMLKPEEKSE